MHYITDIIKTPLSYVDIRGTLILLLAIIMIKKYSMHPIAVMLISGFVGVLLFYLI